MMRQSFFAAALALVPMAAASETITFYTVDFELPDGVHQLIPKSVKKSDIFVSSENCYYVRTADLHFAFISCVG